MHFGENQLSRSLIGLSPLPTGHPPGFQPWWVRSSTRSYPRFNLPMGRSLRFGSTACDSDALFRLAFATATPHGLTLPHTVTRRLILQKARGHFTLAEARTLPRLVGTRFQVLFHDPSPGCFSPFPHGTGPLSVTKEYLGLGGGPPGFTRDFSGPVLLGIPPGSRLSFAYGGVTLCADAFQNVFGYSDDFLLPASSAALAERARNPDHATACRYDTRSVWPVPFSLATTQGIAVAFSSCGY